MRFYLVPDRIRIVRFKGGLNGLLLHLCDILVNGAVDLSQRRRAVFRLGDEFRAVICSHGRVQLIQCVFRDGLHAVLQVS